MGKRELPKWLEPKFIILGLTVDTKRDFQMKIPFI